MAEQRQDQPTGSYWLYCASKCFQRPPPSPEKSPQPLEENNGCHALSEPKATPQKKRGGWKAMPYILGNETFERLGTFGLMANLMVYLMKEFHFTQVSAVNILNIWSGITNFAPLLGAYISDTYIGRFKTIAFSSVAAVLGMVIVTLTAWLPQLHPPKCHVDQQPHGQCRPATTTQLGVFLLGLVTLSIGSGGIRPCSIPFGVDQFDPTTEAGVKGINSYFNWYYTTFTVVILITMTVVVYIQDSVSWVLGFGIPTVLMACSLVVFLVGTRIYVHVKPEGSIFSGIAQVFVAVYKKRKLKLPDNDEYVNVNGVYYDPPLKGTTVLSKLPLTNQLRFLNKAAMIADNDDLKSDGTPTNHWRLCTIQQVEEVKCLVRIIPVWASGIISVTSMLQQGTFTVSQAMKMNRHLGPKFQIPPATIGVISMITIGIWLPFYDRVLVPALRRATKHEGGITLLQRMGIGIIFSILSMIVAGLVEKERRAAANFHPQSLGIAPMSVMWLAPQLILMGFCEAFNVIGQIEFFNSQFPDHMKSVANCLLSISFAFASYLNSLVVAIVHGVTGRHGHPDWLTNDINAGRLDYFYYLIAGMGALNSIYFLYCAKRYRYKGSGQLEDKTYPDLELDSIKP